MPLVIGAYTYIYSVDTNEERITSEAHRALLRTLGQRAETIRYFLNQQNLSQVHHEISQIGENPKIRQTILYGDQLVLASAHIAHRGSSIEAVIVEEYGMEATQMLERVMQHSNSTRLTVWNGSDGKSIYGMANLVYTDIEGSMRPNKIAHLLIQSDLSRDLNASKALTFNIIIAQFVLSLLVILLVYRFVISRFNMLKKLAGSVLHDKDTYESLHAQDEFGLFGNTIKHLASELAIATDNIKNQHQFTLNLINSTEEGIFGIDMNGDITFANHAFLNLLGYQSEAEVIGKSMHQLIHHSRRNREKYPLEDSPIYQSLTSLKKVHSDQEVFWRADGNYLEVEYWTSLLLENEQPSGSVITFVDVSERKKIQNDLIIRDAAISNAVHGILMADMNGKIFYVNDAMVNMWAYDSGEEMVGIYIASLWQDAEQSVKLNEVVTDQKKSTAEMAALRKDNTNFTAHLSLSISNDENGQPLCMMGSFIDISVQKETEASLLRSEETYAKAEEIAHIGSWDWNILSGDLHWTDEIYRIFGQKPQSFGATYEAFVETIHPGDRDRVGEAVGAAVADANIVYDIEHRVVRPEGEIRIVNERGKVYRNDAGEPIRMIGTVHDITEKMKYEKELDEERNFVSAILDSAGALVIVLDSQGSVVRFNRTCQDITSFSEEEIVGSKVWKHLLKPEMKDIASEMFSNLENIPSEYSNLWITRQGDELLIDWSNRPLRDEAGKIEFIVSLGIDITEKDASEKELEKYRQRLELLVDERTSELKQAQNELVRSERLATLGQLTATVSHELRNPLGAMRPSMYIIKKYIGTDDDKLNNAIRRVERNIGRCDQIIDELLDFTRITDISDNPTSIDNWLSEVLEDQHIPDHIQLNSHYGLEGIEINMDPHRMRRCIINVVENACHAIADKNKNSTSDQRLSVTSQKKNNRIEVVVEDTGSGIDEETQEKIFEPLFSTKSFGVGLGLPTVKQIMQQHQGGIDISSESGTGTRVILWLPDSRVVK